MTVVGVEPAGATGSELAPFGADDEPHALNSAQTEKTIATRAGRRTGRSYAGACLSPRTAAIGVECAGACRCNGSFHLLNVPLSKTSIGS